MIHYIKYLFFLLCTLLAGYMGFRTYIYMFDETLPHVAIHGIEDQGYYAGDMAVTIQGLDNYKVDHVSMWLDDKQLHDTFKVNASSFEHPVTLSAQHLADGKHTLRCKVVDGTKHANSSEVVKEFYTDNVVLQAAFVHPEKDLKVLQGRCLHVQFQVNKSVKSAVVKALSKEFPAFAESQNAHVYEAFIPVDCEQQAHEYVMTIEITDFVGTVYTLENKFQVVSYPFKKKVLHVSNDKVKKEAELAGQGDKELESALAALTKNSPHQKLWQGTFEIPITMTGMSTEFGVIRTSQQRGRYMHKAVDILGIPRSVVWASQDGKVALVDRYNHSGNTVVIDHGWGVLSMYFHLDEIAQGLQVGQMIKKGKPVGTIGMTGFANGYHLHWEIRVDNVPVDPMQWTKTSF